jgi:hypothetical protein
LTDRSFLRWFMLQVCRNRLFEWAMAVIMIWLGVKLLLHPSLLAHSTFRLLLVLVSTFGMIALLLFVGLARVVVLAIDGHYLRTWTPQLRALLSVTAAMIWGQMGIALELITHFNGVPTMGSPVYFGLMLAELFSTYRPLARDRGNGI